MRLRPFDPDTDFDRLRGWIADERAHALWCANRFPFPLEKSGFPDALAGLAQRTGDTPFAAEEDGVMTGFFCYSLNRAAGEGTLKFIIVAPECRGRGTAREMLRLALEQAFADPDAERVRLSVFSENGRARRCYERAGFTEVFADAQAFAFGGERWDRCGMAVRRSSSSRGGKQRDAMKTGYVIRKAVPEDEESIRALYAEMLRTICRTETVQGYESGSLDRFWAGGGDRIYVAEAGRVVAFLSVEVHREAQAYLYLDDFSVTEAYRNRGIGTELLRTAEACAQELGIPAVTLHVEKSNVSALRLYERRGYAVFRDDGSRYLMVKECIKES